LKTPLDHRWSKIKIKMNCGREISCQPIDLGRRTAMKLILVVALQNFIDLFGLHKGSSCTADPKIKWRI